MIQSGVIQLQLWQMLLGLVSIAIVGFFGSFLGSVRAEERRQAAIDTMKNDVSDVKLAIATETEDRQDDVDRLEGKIEKVDDRVNRLIERPHYRPGA
jgi:cob(I)alamin adenosyltransferase